jgi:hypothetical protein
MNISGTTKKHITVFLVGALLALHPGLRGSEIGVDYYPYESIYLFGGGGGVDYLFNQLHFC